MEIKLFIKFLDSENCLIEKVDFFCLTGRACCHEHELLNKIGQSLHILKDHLLSVDILLEAKLDKPQIALNKLRKEIKYETSVYKEKLSQRETEVVSLIIQGLTNKEISEHLFISFETVRSHRKSILKKIGVRNTASLINYYNQTFIDD